jgi:hypothetical protein
MTSREKYNIFFVGDEGVTLVSLLNFKNLHKIIGFYEIFFIFLFFHPVKSFCSSFALP